MKRTTQTGGALLVTAISLTACGPSAQDEAGRFVEQACTELVELDLQEGTQDWVLQANLTALQSAIDDDAAPALASAAKRDPTYEGLHAAAGSASRALGNFKTALTTNDPQRIQTVGDDTIEAVGTLLDQCDVILAD